MEVFRNGRHAFGYPWSRHNLPPTVKSWGPQPVKRNTADRGVLTSKTDRHAIRLQRCRQESICSIFRFYIVVEYCAMHRPMTLVDTWAEQSLLGTPTPDPPIKSKFRPRVGSHSAAGLSFRSHKVVATLCLGVSNTAFRS